MNDWLTSELLLKARLLAPVVLLLMFWGWETWHPFFRHPFAKQPRRYQHAGHNLGLTAFNSILLALTLSGMTVGVADWTLRNQHGLLHWLGVSHIVSFVLAMIVLDGWMYIWHRANHAIPILWRFHRMHHSDNQMDVTTASRFHLGEHVLSNGLRLGLIPVMGLSIWQLVSYEIFVIAMTQLQHANISLGKRDRWMRLLFVTPDMHKVHHSRWQPETDSNYATVFSFWDRIAKTFRLRTDLENIEFGLDSFDDPQWQTIRGLLKTPFRRKPQDPNHGVDESTK